MKILQVSSIQEETPPSGYGGIERFVHYLGNTLSSFGNEVTVVCKGGSKGGNYKTVHSDTANLLKCVSDLLQSNTYDIVHLHIRDADLISYLDGIKQPTVITLHNNVRKSSAWVGILTQTGSSIFVTTISESLNNRLKEAFIHQNKKEPVHGMLSLGYGMDVYSYVKRADPSKLKKYYVYIGGLFRYKSVLDIAKKFVEIGEELLVVGPKDRNSEPDYIEALENMFEANKNIRYYGETKNEADKIDVLSKAKGLIIATGYDPSESDCHEAFGLVMLEANSLGVPVFGYAKGNVKDYIQDGINGYKFENMDELPKLLKTAEAEDLFSQCIEVAKGYEIEIIAKRYQELFKKIVQSSDGVETN